MHRQQQAQHVAHQLEQLRQDVEPSIREEKWMGKNAMTTILTPPDTKRLTFRIWMLRDVEPFHAICSDSSVMQFVGEGKPWTHERTQQFIERAVAMQQAEGFCQWPLINKSDSMFIGYCGFVTSDESPEIGWRLSPAYWGQGLATEAARVVLEHGFSSLGFERVIATVQSKNVASIRVIEKLGMKPDKTLERGGNEMVVYALSRTDASA